MFLSHSSSLKRRAGVRELDTLGAWLLEKIVRGALDSGQPTNVVGVAARYEGLIEDIRQANSDSVKQHGGTNEQARDRSFELDMMLRPRAATGGVVQPVNKSKDGTDGSQHECADDDKGSAGFHLSARLISREADDDLGRQVDLSRHRPRRRLRHFLCIDWNVTMQGSPEQFAICVSDLVVGFRQQTVIDHLSQVEVVIGATGIRRFPMILSSGQNCS